MLSSFAICKGVRMSFVVISRGRFTKHCKLWFAVQGRWGIQGHRLGYSPLSPPACPVGVCVLAIEAFRQPMRTKAPIRTRMPLKAVRRALVSIPGTKWSLASSRWRVYRPSLRAEIECRAVKTHHCLDASRPVAALGLIQRHVDLARVLGGRHSVWRCLRPV